MKRQPQDDWGTPLGSDPDQPAPQTTRKTPRQDSLTGLIAFFADNLPTDSWGKLNAPVNAPAMMTALKKLRTAGHTTDQIRGMMVAFIADINKRPLPNGVAPWRGFIANLDSLSSRATTKDENYDDLQVDPRLDR